MATYPYPNRPADEPPFDPVAAREAIREVLNEELVGQSYNDIYPDLMAYDLGRLILERIMALPCNGYKYVVNVVLTERNSAVNGLLHQTSVLWDLIEDTIAEVYMLTDRSS